MYGKEYVIAPEDFVTDFLDDREGQGAADIREKLLKLKSSGKHAPSLKDIFPLTENVSSGYATVFVEDEVAYDLGMLLKQDPIDRNEVIRLRNKYLNWGKS
jgi:hypothetical protein